MGTRFTGKNNYIEWIYSGGTVVLSGDYRTLEVTETAAEVDASAGDDAMSVFLAGAKGATWTCEFLDTVGGTATFSAVVPQTEGTLTWSPEGTAAGKPKYSADAIILGRNPSYSYNGVSTIRLNGRLNSAISATAH